MISESAKVSICNQSLAMVGVSAITAMDDETDKARFCNAWLEDMIYELAYQHNWQFLTAASTELSRYQVDDEDVTPLEYDYSYVLPSDTFVVLELWDSDTKSEHNWEVRLSPDRTTMMLCTDQDDDVYVKYMYVAGTDKTLCSYDFWNVIKLRLAARLATALHGNMQMSVKFDAEAEAQLARAIMRDDYWSHNQRDEARESSSWQKAGR